MRSYANGYSARTYRNAVAHPVANPAIAIDSTIAKGACGIRKRALNVPGNAVTPAQLALMVQAETLTQ